VCVLGGGHSAWWLPASASVWLVVGEGGLFYVVACTL